MVAYGLEGPSRVWASPADIANLPGMAGNISALSEHCLQRRAYTWPFLHACAAEKALIVAVQSSLCAWRLLVVGDHNLPDPVCAGPQISVVNSISYIAVSGSLTPLAPLLPCCNEWAKPRPSALSAAPTPVYAGSCGASASPASCALAIEPSPTKGLTGAPTLRRIKPAQSRGWLSSLLRSAMLLCMRLLSVCPDALSVEQATAGLLWWHCMGRCAWAATSPCLQCRTSCDCRAAGS